MAGGKYEFGATNYIRTVLRAWRVDGIGGQRHQLRVVHDPAHSQWQVVYKAHGDTSIDAHDTEAEATAAAKRLIDESEQEWVETSARAHERL